MIAKTTLATSAPKPKWISKCNPQRHHCRDFFMHPIAGMRATSDHDPAPVVTNVQAATNYAMILTPKEIQQPKQSNGAYGDATTANTLQREKELPQGDDLNPLIAWCSFVAKLVHRKEWRHNAKVRMAVNNEWAKLRAAVGGKGTWDERVVRNDWTIKEKPKNSRRLLGSISTSVPSLTCADSNTQS